MERLALAKLLAWKDKTRRKPLMVYGARQVGKTYLIKDIFAERYYAGNYIYVNFKFDDDIRNFVNGAKPYKTPTSNASKIMDFLSLREGRAIDENTLLVFDEIQEALPAISSLKDFKENHPRIPVIATGSLVRIKMKRMRKDSQGFFYPVGAIDTLHIYPMTFEEFLLNRNHMLLERIKSAYESMTPLDESIHALALSHLRDFLLVGGMPENVQIFLESGSHVLARRNLETIYDDYLSDMDLYGASRETLLRCRLLYKNLYLQLNKENKDLRPSMMEEGGKVRQYVTPMELLKLAGVIYPCKRIKETVTLPLREDEGGNYRVYFLDNGFLAYQSDVGMNDFVHSVNANMGVFYENYVATEFAAAGIDLFYWKGKNDAEFEFVVREGNDIVPVDVKKGKGTLNSLEKFRYHNKNAKAVKLSSNNFGYDETNKILTIPLYGAFMYARHLGDNFAEEFAPRD